MSKALLTAADFVYDANPVLFHVKVRLQDFRIMTIIIIMDRWSLSSKENAKKN